MAVSFEQWSRCLRIFLRGLRPRLLRLAIWLLRMSANAKVVGDSRGAREAHHGKNLGVWRSRRCQRVGVWRCRFPSRRRARRLRRPETTRQKNSPFVLSHVVQYTSGMADFFVYTVKSR